MTIRLTTITSKPLSDYKLIVVVIRFRTETINLILVIQSTEKSETSHLFMLNIYIESIPVC